MQPHIVSNKINDS